MKVYSIQTNWSADFGTFSTLEAAQKELEKLAEERKCKPGVREFEASKNKFSYIFGREEVEVSFFIKEIEVRD